jgi:phage tail tube protein FII
MNFTEHQVEQYEMFAKILKSFDNVTDNMETKFLMFILNIESLLPFSNSFDYILKNDLYKNELEHIDQEMWKLKNRLSDIHNDIDDSEWKVDTQSTEEVVFNSLKQKLIIEKKLNYGNI